MALDTGPSKQQPAPKPIRFITNDGRPYAKRRRINTACNTCRRRKTRCSGEKPFCETCRNTNQACEGYGDKDDGAQSPTREDNPIKPVKSNSTSNATRSEPQPSPGFRPPKLEDVASGIVPEDGTSSPHREGSMSNGSFTTTLSIRNRMPYFRYFGPTAIMPGFKQMVVKVNDKQRGTTNTSSVGDGGFASPPTNMTSGAPATESPAADDAPTPVEPPVYDASDMAPNPLIIHLCDTFFANLGCNYPFLQKERFMRDLEEKQVDAILVDAVCALAARFSNDPLLSGKALPTDGGTKSPKREIPPPERGQLFAARAKAAIPDAFPCPSVAVVQAALLLAYDEFGANRDSGLWMYLGIAIRMAQDLGMQKLEGLRYIGRHGPTPRTIRYTRDRKRPEPPPRPLSDESRGTSREVEEVEAVERERVDTFWAVFCLDRYISSGTGRPVALRDEDIEVAFPALDETEADGWPKLWPALIRIVHLYGRVSDILNGIKEVSHMTPEVIDRLTGMESNLTDLYQGLSSRLHFNAVNFQHYVQAGQGTNFVMLHFWFHTLIVMLHQPTLLRTFDREIQELFPRSREVSMSSAKTIADIFAFTELMSAKSALGNPFTSQPTYIAACAFLKESALHAITSGVNSRAPSPPADGKQSASGRRSSLKNGNSVIDQQTAAKHTLLASAANQNYQRCYRALENLEEYWAGTKYILTVLDQKAKGVNDALLYTREEMESALEVPKPEPAFTSPGWRRKLSWGAYLGRQETSPHAIGWSLTGTMNSPKSASLAVLYPPESGKSPRGVKRGSGSRWGVKTPTGFANGQLPFDLDGAFLPPDFSATSGDGSSQRLSDADLLLNLNSPFNNTSSPRNFDPNTFNAPNFQPPNFGNTAQQPQGGNEFAVPNMHDHTAMPYGDMMIESQDIDMSILGGDDMMWLEYLPTDGMNGPGFDPGGGASGVETS